MLPNLLDSEAFDIEDDSVGGWQLGDLGHNECEVFRRDLGTDSTHIDVLGRATNTVDRKQSSALQDEVISVPDTYEAI